MYAFKDTTDHTTPSQVLPSEAVSIDGVYLENEISGYRTLYVKGRETLSPEVEFGEVGVRDGSYLKNKRFPARVLTIGYQLVASTTTEFNTAFQKLNDMLNVEDAEIIFRDEQDKYLTGTPTGFAEIPAGQLSIKSEFTIVCADPFKYSVTEYSVSPTLDDGATFSVNYNGTYPAYPVLQTNFYESNTAGNTDGDCGFVAFSTPNGDVLQFGYDADPSDVTDEVEKIVDQGTWSKNKTLVNDKFNALTNWTTNNGYTGSIYYLQSGTPAVGFLKNGTNKALYISDFGSGSQWHGASVKREIPNDGGNPSVNGAKDWKVHGTLRFSPSATAKTAKKQSGRIFISILNSNGMALGGIAIAKKAGSSDGTIKMYVRNKVVKTFKNVDLSHYNKFFGYKKKSKDKRPCNYDIIKNGKKISFKAGGKTFSYSDNNLANTTATHISIYISKWGNDPNVSWMGVYGCQFTSTSVQQTMTTETWEELTEEVEAVTAFTTNDVLVCDCNDGTIRLMNAFATDEVNGGLHPELGALGNDWETFVLTKGNNQIGTMYSDWVASAYKPTFTLRYRERFL